MEDQRNFIVAAVLCIMVLLGWQFLYAIPQMERQKAIQEAEAQRQSEQAPTASNTDIPAPSQTNRAADLVEGLDPSAKALPRDEALALSPRVTIKSDKVDGSIALKGALFDDLHLMSYRETLDPESSVITLLSPVNSQAPYFAKFSWRGPEDGNVAVPTDETVWAVKGNSTLTPTSPVTLAWSNGQGLEFEREIAVDDNYLFTVKDSVQNNGSAEVTLYPYAIINRKGTPDITGIWILHEGLIGVFNQTLETFGYRALRDGESLKAETTGGWLGITDKYWMTALIPDQTKTIFARFIENARDPSDSYQADFVQNGLTIAPGTTTQNTTHFFAGAKKVGLIDKYRAELNIDRFDLAIDWGWFYFITKPLFYILDWSNQATGNFGIAILLLTVLIKIAFFPLANKSYEAMSKMKKLQPEMIKLRDRYQDDKVKQQQELMELYKKEKINPLAGCLPVLIQIPVFFALYKVLFVTIEMRHAPFFGWIQDLAAPDPTSIFNLFGLIPIDLPQILMVGIWPIIMGATMFLQTKMNPAPNDPMQEKIFLYMPIVFTFVLASFPAGLVIYWAWNNVLSILQQYVIMRRNGVDLEWEKKFSSLFTMFQSADDKSKEGLAAPAVPSTEAGAASANADGETPQDKPRADGK